jgi:hypothetical protein
MKKKTHRIAYRIKGTCGAKVVVNGKEYELVEDVHGGQWAGMEDIYPTEACAQTTTGEEVWWMFDDGEALDQWAEKEDWNANINGVIELDEDDEDDED